MASSPPTSSVQAGRASVQSAAWASPAHSDWRTTVNSLPLPVAVNYGHLTPSHVIQCHGPARASAIVRLVLPVTSVERFADQPPSASPLPWTVTMGAKNAFIWLCLQGSDLLFLGADYNLLTV